MSYAGNPSLALETKDRIVTTYNQTLDLAGQGRGQESALGCDFILKMDPLFTPARKLQTRLQGASGPVDVADLEKLPLPSEAMAVPVGAGTSAAAVSPAATVHITPEIVAQAAAAASPSPRSPTPPSPAAPSSPPAVPLEAIIAETAAPVQAAPVAVIAEPIPLETIAPAAPLVAEPVPVSAVPVAGEGDRIGQLLAEGQGLFEAGDFQGAIDAWSRIFLIDIDHQEAAERIELARKLKDEQERKLDEVLFEAAALRDAGDLAGAREAYERVLEMQPNHPAANDAIQRLDAGDQQPEAGPPLADDMPLDEGGLDLPETDLYDPDASPGAGPSALGSAPPGAMPGFGGVASKKKSRGFPLIAGVVALVLGVGGFVLWTNKDKLFPNSDPPPVEATGRPDGMPQIDPIEKATTLFDQGETDMAMARLEEIPEGNSFYDRAQQQLGVWRDQVGGEEEPPDISDVDAKRLARRNALLDLARHSYSEKEYLTATKAFRAAEKLAALDGAAADLYEDAQRQLLPIRQQIDFFNEKEWERVLPALWKLKLQDPSNKDVKRLLADTYFNLSLRELQRGTNEKALENIKEVVALYSEDTMAERIREFCDGYRTEPKDLLYRIFVRRLKYRR